MKSIISGVNGQDGSYLAEFLLQTGHVVIGFSRRVCVNTDINIRHLLDHPSFKYIEGDVTDSSFVNTLIHKEKPDHFYNLAAQSHVQTSFSQPYLTTEIVYLGLLNVLNAVKEFSPKTRVYQASSSEQFGSSYSIDSLGNKYQDENTPFCPNSPYAVAKLAAHNLVRVYRESYGMHCCAGILFNHESGRRGENFVTRKIIKYLVKLVRGETKDKLRLGNIDASRDWGHAKDYVRAMYLMLSSNVPKDYVIATGETHTIREFLDLSFSKFELNWKDYVVIDPSLFRPCEVPYLRGISKLAREELKWEPLYDFNGLIQDMIYEELKNGNSNR